MENAHLKEAIDGLPERARYVLVRRYGLDDREPATLAELGEELDISRERVRQLQREAERIRKHRLEERVEPKHVGRAVMRAGRLLGPARRARSAISAGCARSART